MDLRKYLHLDTVICIVVALLAVWAVGRHPYNYYVALRWLVFGTGIYMAWQLYQSKAKGLPLLFVGTAILFNPLASFRFERETWALLDLACAAVFFFAAFITTQIRKQ